jgi:hypothetical protein
MIGNSNCFTLPRDGAAFAGTYAVDSVRAPAFTRPSMGAGRYFYTMDERQFAAGTIEGATKE